MKTDVIEKDKTSELAEQKLAQMNADEKVAADEKVKAEAKDAASDDSSTEKAKIEGSEDEDKAKAIQKTDVVILNAEDKDLTEPELERKKVLVQEAEDAKTPEQKQQEWQEKVQKRIDGLSGELKAEREGRNQDKDTIDKLTATIASLKGDLETSGSLESQTAKDIKNAEQRYAQMVIEDKDLPREQRREMSEEDLEEFLLEDMGKAHVWITRRELRHAQDIQNAANSRNVADNIAAKAKQFYDAFPDCNAGFVKQNELINSGMSDVAAVEAVSKDNPDFALMMELFKEDKKYSDPNNGPDLMLAEMKARKSKVETITKEEAEKMAKDAVEAEKRRMANVDTGLSNSSANVGGGGDAIYDEGLKLFIQAGKRKGQVWTKKDYDETLQYGRTARRT